MRKGFFAAEGLDLEMNFAQSGAAVTQQLTGGVARRRAQRRHHRPDPRHRQGRAAGARPHHRQLRALRADRQTRAEVDRRPQGQDHLGRPDNDITTVYFERMMAANGLKNGDYDDTRRRRRRGALAALKAGVVDAAIVLPPLNFQAKAAGFVTLGFAADYVKDLPFTGMAVRRRWAAANVPAAKRLLAATDKSIAWLADAAHRDEAIELLVRSPHATKEDAEASYDLLRRIDYSTRKVAPSPADEGSAPTQCANQSGSRPVMRSPGQTARPGTIPRARAPRPPTAATDSKSSPARRRSPPPHLNCASPCEPQSRRQPARIDFRQIAFLRIDVHGKPRDVRAAAADRIDSGDVRVFVSPRLVGRRSRPQRNFATVRPRQFEFAACTDRGQSPDKWLTDQRLPLVVLAADGKRKYLAHHWQEAGPRRPGRPRFAARPVDRSQRASRRHEHNSPASMRRGHHQRIAIRKREHRLRLRSVARSVEEKVATDRRR